MTEMLACDSHYLDASNSSPGSDVPSQSSGDEEEASYDDELYAQAIADWRQVLPIERSGSDQNFQEICLLGSKGALDRKKAVVNENSDSCGTMLHPTPGALTHEDFMLSLLEDVAQRSSARSSTSPVIVIRVSTQ